MSAEPGTELDLADWRRSIARLYADVRFLYRDDPVAAWQLWRAQREALYREHPRSPVIPDARAAFRGRFWGYDRRYAFELEVRPDEPEAPGDTLRRLTPPHPPDQPRSALPWPSQ